MKCHAGDSDDQHLSFGTCGIRSLAALTRGWLFRVLKVGVMSASMGQIECSNVVGMTALSGISLGNLKSQASGGG